MIHEHIMASGSWELDLHPDTPREILDRIVPFSTVHVAPGRIDINGAADTDLVKLMRWAGIVLRPGPQTRIGGQGLAMWLGDADGRVFVGGPAPGRLPDTPIGKSGKPLTEWLDDILQGTELVRSICSTANLSGGPFQWTATPRDVLDWVSEASGCEWRVNPNYTVDLDQLSALYGAVPTATITRRSGGREIGTNSIDGEFTVEVDAEDYATHVTVLGAAGIGTASTSMTYHMGPWGLVVWKVVQDQQVAAGAEASTANALLTRYAGLRRDVRLTSDLFDVRGEIQTGALVAVWDPEGGLYDTAAAVHHRGEWITPITLRCTSIDWPVRAGMGVYLRTYDPPPVDDVAWIDLTDYVVPEDAATEIGLGANRRWSQQ